MKRLALVALCALSACVETAPPAQLPPPPSATLAPLPGPGPRLSPAAAAGFAGVVARMGPVIEAECRDRARAARMAQNCDFNISTDNRPGQPPNAYQSLDPVGRPQIAFTRGLIAEARNPDELAFVLGHEAAHHIARHIPRQQQSAMSGALILGALTAVGGGDEAAIRSAQNIGGTLGARRYSKDFELEADALGTLLAWDAGYDPERGAAFFARIPDPGNQFLGTHPPNAQRLDTVRRTLAGLR